MQQFALHLYKTDMRQNLHVGLCGRLLCPEGWRLPASHMARLQDWVLWFVWAGEGTLHANQETVDLIPGVCIWMRPGVTYEAEHTPGRRLGVNYLHFTPGQKTPEPPWSTYSPNLNFADESAKRIIELTRQQPSNVRARKLAEELFQTLVDQLLWENERWGAAGEAGPDKDQRRIIQRVAADMQHREGPPPSVRDLAARAGYSPDHFTRLFRTVMNTSPKHYQVEARITQARELLLNTHLKVAAIAELLGYRNIYFFSRQFRQKTSQTPSQFRKAGQKG